jgi:CRISPR/Cas system-associated endonuclease Cas1
MSQEKSYLVTRKSFIDGHLLEEGDIIKYAGKAGNNLQLLDADGKPVPANMPDGDGADLETLRQQYEELFNEKPHFNTGAAKLQAAIDEKRNELGAN